MESDSNPDELTIEHLRAKVWATKQTAKSSYTESKTRVHRPIRYHLHGKTAAEWDRHRGIIQELYSRSRLEDVQDWMEKEHGFKASRRMYYANFKRWGLHKNLKAKDKDDLEAVLLASSPPIDLNENICRRIERHRKTKKSAETFRSWNSTQLPATGKERATRGPLALPYDSFLLSSSSSRTRTRSITPSDHATRPSPLESILRCIDSLLAFDELPATSVSPICTGNADQHIEDSTRRFWGNLGCGIHLLKATNATQKAFSFIDKACIDAPAAVLTSSFTFILGLLTILSPRSMSPYLDLRQSILRYIMALLYCKPKPLHLLHRLCTELNNDSPSHSFCEDALSYLLRRQTRAFGTAHSSTLGLRTCLVASKLRGNDYDGAAPMVQAIVSDFRPSIDAGFSQDGFAIRELERTLTERNAGAHSLDTCLSIIWICSEHTASLPVVSTPTDSDTLSADDFTVTDEITKIDELIGAPEARATWLRRAAGIARALWGDCVGYRQVVDRLLTVQRSEGTPEEEPRFLL